MREKINSQYSDLVAEGYDMSSIVFENIEEVWPDILIDEVYSFKLGNVEFKLIPTPGHTPSNIVVYLPPYKVLFAGDTIYSGYPPNTKLSTPELVEKWIKALDLPYNLDIEIIIPGHGPPCNKEEIRRNRALLMRIKK